MPDNTMNGAEKAAILLLAIGEEAASDIFRGLEESEIKLIGQAMARMHEIPTGTVSRVLDEFRREMIQPRGVVTNTRTFLNNALGKALDPGKARNIVNELVAPPKPRGLKALQLSDPRAVARLIQNEHPQICAVVLSTLEPKKIGKILSSLPPQKMADVLLRMGKLEKISPQLLREIEDVLNLSPAEADGEVPIPAGGVKLVAQALNAMQKDTEQMALERLQAADSDLADSVRKAQFTFEDLLGADDRSFQAILREVNRDILVVALKAASPEMREKVFHNVSERAAQMMQEDLEAMGPVKVVEVENARQEMIRVARRLEEEGKITLRTAGEDDDVVR
ncbi:MAG: flagellar motor switch protein FliG [Deltaproteobacteria bacterium]|nr:flagellar motor switch protein FliG [Deltaproteobacteria bacterium]